MQTLLYQSNANSNTLDFEKNTPVRVATPDIYIIEAILSRKFLKCTPFKERQINDA